MANKTGNKDTNAGGYTGQGQSPGNLAGGQASGQGQGQKSEEVDPRGYGKDTGQGQGAATQAQKDVDNAEVDYDETNQGGRSDSPESNQEWSPGSGQPST